MEKNGLSGHFVYLVYLVKERTVRKARSLICLIYSVGWAIRFIGGGRWIFRKPILPHA